MIGSFIPWARFKKGASFRLPLSHCTGCGRDARDPRRAAENTFLSAEFALTPGGKRQRSTKKHEGNTKEGQLQKRGGRICAEPTPSSATWRSANSQIAERRGEHRRRIGFSLRSCAVLRGSVALCSRKSLSHCTGCGRDARDPSEASPNLGCIPFRPYAHPRKWRRRCQNHPLSGTSSTFETFPGLWMSRMNQSPPSARGASTIHGSRR